MDALKEDALQFFQRGDARHRDPSQSTGGEAAAKATAAGGVSDLQTEMEAGSGTNSAAHVQGAIRDRVSRHRLTLPGLQLRNACIRDAKP